MKSRLLLLLCIVAALSLRTAVAGNDATVVAVAQAAVPQPVEAPNRGTLYRIRHDGSTAYLFGTIHVGLPAFYPLEREVTQALAGASRLVVELDVRKPEAFQAALKKHGMYAPGETVARHLSPATLAALSRALEKFDVPYEQVAQLKPWLIANMLVGLDLERNGYQRRHGIELFLLSVAQQQTKPVQELESAEYQLSLYDGMSESEQEQYVQENLAQLNDGDTLKKARALIDAWDGADGKAVEDMLRASREEKTLSSDFLQRVLLDKRNPDMASKIESYLHDKETTFVGVGLLHLVGENGVPSLLRRRGYAVEKLY
jgi:uncharacterized protein